MIINRDNYENYFLLYIDGELSLEDKQAVEQFAQANPDLQAELVMLQQTVLPLDHESSFQNKESLYKSLQQETIGLHNYEERFLLYVDDELDKEQKNSVETFVLQHPQVQESFTQLKQTKLPIEHIDCPNKEALYKKEEKPVIFLWARRLSVTAALLLLAVMAWLLAPTKSVAPVDTAANTFPKKQPTVITTPNTVNNGKAETTSNTQAVQQAQVLPQTMAVNSKNTNSKPIIVPTVQKENKPNKNLTPANNTIQAQDNVLAVVQPVQQSPTKAQPIKTNEQQIVSVKNDKPVSTNSIVSQAVNKNEQAVAIQPVVYRELNTDEDDNGKTVYIGSMEIRKDKINNLFKKAKKLFSKKQSDTPSEETLASATRTLR
jgi:hypothetical protein